MPKSKFLAAALGGLVALGGLASPAAAGGTFPSPAHVLRSVAGSIKPVERRPKEAKITVTAKPPKAPKGPGLEFIGEGWTADQVEAVLRLTEFFHRSLRRAPVRVPTILGLPTFGVIIYAVPQRGGWNYVVRRIEAMRFEWNR